MLGRTDRRWRGVAVLVVMCLLSVSAVLQLGYWQVAQAPWLRERAERQLQRTSTEHAVRGDIYDRNGRLLATTGYRDTLGSWPNVISKESRLKTVGELAEILGLDEVGRARIDAQLGSTTAYQVLQRELTEDQSHRIRAGITSGTLHGLELVPHLVRIYPNPGGQPGTTLASQLLGFVTAADGDSQGHYGIEGQYDTILAGRPKILASAQDGRGQSLESSTQVVDPGADGEAVTISIDASLQLQLERELFAAWNSDKARRVSAMVMDPKSGEILAWASVPGYDANKGGNTDARLLQDPIVSQPYEPGSVMKMLTATSALSNKVVTPSTKVRDSAALRFGPGMVVHNWDRLGMGRITFRDVVAYSRNIGVSRVAARLGRTIPRASTTLYKTWRDMGIGVRTGVDVPGEVPGLAADPRTSPWTPIDLANRAFGQGVTATPVQLATAFAPMINGGLRVQPHFLVAVSGKDQPSAPARRVITRQVAGQLRGILDHVTSSVPWYAQGSLIAHFQVGGKTGTAQIWRNEQHRWDPNTYNFTFVGYVGGDEPAAVVAVTIDEANSISRNELTLNVSSYQLFRRIALGIIHTQGIRQSSDPKAGQPEPGSAAERELEPQRYYRRTHAASRSR